MVVVVVVKALHDAWGGEGHYMESLHLRWTMSWAMTSISTFLSYDQIIVQSEPEKTQGVEGSDS